MINGEVLFLVSTTSYRLNKWSEYSLSLRCWLHLCEVSCVLLSYASLHPSSGSSGGQKFFWNTALISCFAQYLMRWSFARRHVVESVNGIERLEPVAGHSSIPQNNPRMRWTFVNSFMSGATRFCSFVTSYILPRASEPHLEYSLWGEVGRPANRCAAVSGRNRCLCSVLSLSNFETVSWSRRSSSG